jgi:hypothetical protein
MKKTIVLVVGLMMVAALSGFASRGFARLEDPAKMAVALMDYKLDLTDTQEKEIAAIIRGFVSEARAESIKNLAVVGPVIDKFEKGKLESSDVKALIEKRLETMKSREDKAAETVIAVVSKLTDEQRAKASSLIRERLEEIGTDK